MTKTMTRKGWLDYLSTVSAAQPLSTEQQEAVDRLFPNVDPGVVPFGQRVLVQLRLARKTSPGGIHIPYDAQDTERWNESVAQIVALGPLCFKKRDTLTPWAEGQWGDVGDFVRVPKFGGDRWEVPIPGSVDHEMVMFAMFNDFEMIGALTGNPVDMKVYV